MSEQQQQIGAMAEYFERLVKVVAEGYAMTNERLDRVAADINEKIDGLADKLDYFADHVNARFDNVDTRFDRVEGRLDKVETRLETLETKVDQMDSRLERVETLGDDSQQRLERIEGHLQLSGTQSPRTPPRATGRRLKRNRKS